MSNPKRHHFVPECYLNGFVEEDTGFLNIYSKRSDMWRRQKPKQVMVRNKYYHQDWVPEGVDKNILEKTIGSELEPKGLTALKKLVASPGELDDEDLASILVYIQFQRLRVPRQADMAKSLAKKVIRHELLKTQEGQKALKYGKVTIKDSFRFEFLQSVHSSLSPYFSRMVWEVIEAKNDTSFITSDSPVCFHNKDLIPPMEAGPALYGTTVLFPLNKRYLLSMHHIEYETNEKNASDALPKNLDIEDGVIEIRSGNIWNEQQVNATNWVIFQLSQDTIAGENKDILEKLVDKKIMG